MDTKLQHPKEIIEINNSNPILVIRKLNCSTENFSSIQILLDTYCIQTTLETGCLQLVDVIFLLFQILTFFF